MKPFVGIVGRKEFSEEEFAARDIEDIKNPAPGIVIAGEPTSTKEFEEIAKKHATFGATYEVKENQWSALFISLGNNEI